MSDGVGYEKDVCSFCGKPEAGYQRRKDGGTKQYFDACESCARKPYKNEETENAGTKNV